MAEKIGSIYYDLDLRDDKFKTGIKQSSQQAKSFGDTLKSSALAMAALGAASGLALYKIKNGIQDALNASIKMQNSLTGLNSIATAFGQDATRAKQAAQELASDGLMPISDAAVSLKNLLASGFNLDQAITLIKRFKDSAAFGRQSALSFGQAISSATEGIKNGNSILVDNAGVTKNLSIILREAGYAETDLMRATTDAGVRQALFNGILKETTPMLGDAAKLSKSFGGQVEKTKTNVFMLKAAIGTALQPVLTKMFSVVNPIIRRLQDLSQEHPQIVAAIVGITVGVLGLTTAFGALAAVVTILNPMVLAIGALVGLVAGLAVGFGFLVEKLVGWDVVAQNIKAWAFEFWQIHGPRIKEILAGLREAMAAFIATTVEFWQKHGPAIVSALQSLWVTIETQLLPALSELWTILAPYLTPAMKTLAVIIGGVLLAGLLGFVAAVQSTVKSVTALVSILTFLYRNVFKPTIDVLVHLYNSFMRIVRAVYQILEVIQKFIEKIKDVRKTVIESVAGLEEIISNPFKKGFKKITDLASDVKDKLRGALDLNFRNSPSIVDYAKLSSSKIVGIYDQMFSSLDNMTLGSHNLLVGAASSSSGPSQAVSHVIKLNVDGVTAMTRDQTREFMRDGIDAVNDIMRTNNQPEIGNGYIKGASDG